MKVVSYSLSIHVFLFAFQIDLIHLGAKYAPCMRWDSVLDREIKEQRLKERDTACCIRKDRSGCVQSPKSECSKINDPNGAETPRSKWVRKYILIFSKIR